MQYWRINLEEFKSSLLNLPQGRQNIHCLNREFISLLWES